MKNIITPMMSICYIEAFERFAFLGFQVIFVFYLMDYFGFSKGDASLISASFGACVYAFGIFGSLLSDFCFGAKRCVFYGLILLAFGYLFLAFNYLFLALFFLVFGSVFIKSSLSALLAISYPKNTDYAFSVFYIFVNIGCFLGQFIIGFIAHQYGYNVGFCLSFFMIFLSILVYFGSRKCFVVDEIKYDLLKKYIFIFIIFIFVIFYISQFELSIISKIISFFTIVLPFLSYFFVFKKIKEKKPFIILGFYYLIAIFFYMLIFQSFNTLNILVKEKTNGFLFGLSIPSAWYVSFMFFISIFFSILLSNITKKYKVNEPILIAFGVFLSSIAFILAGYLSKFESINSIYILIIYSSLGIAQLIVGAIGISVASKLSPNGFTTSIIGIWFLCSAAAQGLEALIVKNIDFVSYDIFFTYQGLFVFFISILIIIFNKKLRIKYTK